MRLKWHVLLLFFTVMWAQYTCLTLQTGLLAQSYINVLIQIVTVYFFLVFIYWEK